jgi:hypothetical protein
MLALATLIRPEVISSSAEVENHEEKVFTHLDEEKEHGKELIDPSFSTLLAIVASLC